MEIDVKLINDSKNLGFYENKKNWWITLIIIFLILFGILIVLTEGFANGPFIDAIF